MPEKFLQSEYLGDGVYIHFDGHGFWLFANDAKLPTDRIYLEPDVLECLNRFVARIVPEKESGARGE